MSKRRRTKVDSLPNVSGSSEIQTSHIIPPPSEVEALLSDYSFFKENPSFIRDNDAFIKNIAYCRNLQSEITDAIDRRILSSVEPTLRKEQQNILWNLVQYVNRNDLMLNEEMFAGVTQLATDLVFSSATRYKPKSRHRREEDERICDWFEEEEYARDDYYLDSTRWSVHQLTYELILRVLLFQGARDSYIIITYWNEELLRKLLDLFVSPDSRERDYILSIVHVFYKSVVKFRRFIREFISVRIQSIVFEGGSSTEGVTEMLEFCSAIIRGFAIPLKKEHEDFLMRCLLPLHRLENLNSFYPSLLFCVMAYLEKNACLAAPVLKYLLRRWPVSNSSKVVLFLNHLEEILAATPANILTNIICKTTHRIGACIASLHSHISHRAFLLLENGQVWSLLLYFQQDTFPILATYLENAVSSHWDRNIVHLASAWSQRLRVIE